MAEQSNGKKASKKKSTTKTRSRGIRIPDPVYRRLKVGADLKGMKLGEYVEWLLQQQPYKEEFDRLFSKE